MEKKKSKTNVLQKFVEKFKKKKRAKSNSMSRERSSELSRGRRKKSPSKLKVAVSGPPSTSAEAKSKMDTNLMEVTAKGFKKEAKEKKSTKKKKEKENPAPSKSPSTIALRRADSQMEVSGNSRMVEKAVKTWIETLEKGDFKKTMETDFLRIDAMKIDMEKCQSFEKNRELCQSDTVELFDVNRVKGGGEADFFYHGSVVTCPAITTKSTILAQLALLDSPQSLESFWLMVAAQKIESIYVLLGDDELDKKSMAEYFPEDFVEFKTIKVNNRKTTVRTDDQTNNQMYYEIVPKDCAEAPFAMIEICDFWPDAKIPTVAYSRIAATAASVFDSDISPGATCGIVSNFGAGRAGAFLVGALSIERLRAGEPPSIKDIATSVRSQRPGAIETLSQYIFTHIIALHYSLKHVKDAALKARIEKVISQLEQFACEKMTEDDEEETATTTATTTTD